MTLNRQPGGWPPQAIVDRVSRGRTSRSDLLESTRHGPFAMMPIPLEPSVLDAPVEGRNLRPGTLRDQLGARPTLLVFLRHLGCLFTREWLAELRGAAASDPSFPASLFFHLGTTEQGEVLFADVGPEVRAVADPKRFFYKALGVPSASVVQLLDPRVWACGIRAFREGHKPGKPVGDPLVMPGLFLVEGGQVTWRFVPGHMGGLPRLADIPRPVAV
jgi:hypothetical protein